MELLLLPATDPIIPGHAIAINHDGQNFFQKGPRSRDYSFEGVKMPEIGIALSLSDSVCVCVCVWRIPKIHRGRIIRD